MVNPLFKILGFIFPGLGEAIDDYEEQRLRHAHGDIEVYHLLGKPNDYRALRERMAATTTWAERFFYTEGACHVMSLHTLKRWVDHEPDSADAMLCYASRLFFWAWEVRGGGRADSITEEDWREFFRRLDIAREHLLKSAQMNPADPTPWTHLIRLATGYSDSDATKWHYFNQAKQRDPENWGAHRMMVFALTEKWGGSNQEMIAFAREASANARDGSDLPAILVKAYLENWIYLKWFDEDEAAAAAFLDDPAIRRDIVTAYERSLAHPDFVASKSTIFVRYLMSAWFWHVRDRERLCTEFAQMGNRIEGYHWADAGGWDEFEEAQAFCR